MMMNEVYRTPYYLDAPGNKLHQPFSDINQLSSGITSGVTAGTLNLLSGLTVSASIMNMVLYGSSLLKFTVSSLVASDAMTISHGLTSGLYCFVSPHTGGVIAGGYVSGGTGITFRIQANAGIFFTPSSATVDFMVIGR